MAFSRKVMRGIRRRMAQKRATRRNQQKLLRRAGNPKGRVPSLGEQKRIRESEASKQRRTSGRANPNLTGGKQATLARNPKTLSEAEKKLIREAIKKGERSVKPIKGRGPRMIVDPKRPTTRVRHSGQGRGGRGGIPDVKAPIQPRQARLANSRGVRPSYFKGGLSATKNAIGPNDYRKTGTTLSVKDNRKKTK